MKAKEFIIEYKKDRRAPKYSLKPRSPVAHAAQSVISGSGAHKDKKRAEKQGDVKHKNRQIDMAEGVRDLEYDAQSLIMKLRRDVEEKRLQPTRDAVLMAARELAGDMDFAPELLVQQVLGQRVAEQELDEKSTSQAQFRTMAAAAHNPAFARKVGIDTDVAQEFHGADRGQDYKDLPKKANEAAPVAPDPQNYDSDWDYYNDRDAEEPEDTDADYENMIDEPSDDWFDESRQKVGNMDADAFDDALARMKKLAGAGPLKTVYDPNKRVYKNVPTAQQPAKQPQK